MKYLNKSKIKEIENFYMGDLLKTFDNVSYRTLQVFFYKHLTEIDLILENCKNLDKDFNKIELLDIGGGLGINCIILKKIFGINTTVIDRLDEFDEKHNRATGSDESLKKRLYDFQVNIIQSNFIDDNFKKIKIKYDCICCFSVIEHFNFSPKFFLNQLYRICKKNSCILISTPNQLHLLNRLRALLGINIWENFDYYYESDQYFGHVREFTADEMILIGNKISNLKFIKLDYSNFPLYSNNSLHYFNFNFILKICAVFYEFVSFFNPKFKLHLTLILKMK